MSREMHSDELTVEVEEKHQEQRRWQRRRIIRVMNEYAKENRWLLPVLGGVVGIALGFVIARVGDSPDPDRWTITVSGVRNGLLSVLSILFAGLSIVLAVASVTAQNVVGRYSLRMMRIYLRESQDMLVIAGFMLASTFTLAVQFRLFALPQDALAPIGSVVTALILLFFSGGLMIWYIGSTMQWFRVGRVVRRIAQLTVRIARDIAREHVSDSPVNPTIFERPEDAIDLTVANSGFLVDVDTEGLFDLAQEYNVAFFVNTRAGQSVAPREPIGWIIRGDNAAQIPTDRVGEMIEVADLREPDTTIFYGIVVLVDIAIMALSPAINDPYTAVQVIEEMCYLFPQLADVPMGPFGRADEEGRTLVAVQARTIGDYAEIATTQILLYGSQDPTIIRAMLHLVQVLEGLELSESDREDIESLRRRVQKVADKMAASDEFQWWMSDR